MTSVTAVLLSLAAGAQAAPADKGDERVRPQIIRPTYTVKVQADPVLPKGDRPDPTPPAGDGRVAVSIQPERRSFPGNGPVGVTVTLTNRSEKPLRVYGVEKLGRRPELVLVHQKTGAQTRMTGDWEADLKQPPATLEPGKSLTRTFAIVQAGGAVPPGPIPLPRPVPFPLPRPRAEPLGNDRDAAPGAPREKTAAAERFPAVVAVPSVIAPEGTVRMLMMLEFTVPEGDGKRDAAVWTGKIASQPIDVEFTRPVWKAPPQPPIGGPVTKEQAVTLAHRAAEAALTAAYNPQDPVRPPKEGAWISHPEKTATVKERPNNAGWTVSWTHTQKGKGHSYHVVIEVSTSGQATVREAFAGYSNR